MANNIGKRVLAAGVIAAMVLTGCPQPTSEKPGKEIEKPEPKLEVSLDGNSKVGDTLTARVVKENISGDVTYTWYRDGVQIGGATGESYTPADADVGATISVVVVVGGKTASAATAQKVREEKRFNVSISGTAKVGQELTASVDTEWEGAKTYSWNGSGTPKNTDKYTLVEADEGRTITLTVTVAGKTRSASSATVLPQYANLAPAGFDIKIENHTTLPDSYFTTPITLSDGEMVIAESVKWQYEGVRDYGSWMDKVAANPATKIIITNENSLNTNGNIVRINFSTFNLLAGISALSTSIFNAIRGAYDNPVVASMSKSQGIRLAKALQQQPRVAGAFAAYGEGKKAILRRNNYLVNAKASRVYVG